MLWATSEFIHFDRVAAAWAIKRFIDPDATFVFLRPGAPIPYGATPFGLPNVPLASHDADSSTFRRVIDHYALDAMALADIAAIVDAVIDHVMHGLPLGEMVARSPESPGMLIVAEGVMLLAGSDDACLEQCLPLYDALLARLEARAALDSRHAAHPFEARPNDAFPVANAVATLRRAGRTYSKEDFSDALAANRVGGGH